MLFTGKNLTLIWLLVIKSKIKKDFDPVTNFDRSFEKYLRSLIGKAFPEDSIIGEEFEANILQTVINGQ